MFTLRFQLIRQAIRSIKKGAIPGINSFQSRRYRTETFSSTLLDIVKATECGETWEENKASVLTALSASRREPNTNLVIIQVNPTIILGIQNGILSVNDDTHIAAVTYRNGEIKADNSQELALISGTRTDFGYRPLSGRWNVTEAAIAELKGKLLPNGQYEASAYFRHANSRFEQVAFSTIKAPDQIRYFMAYTISDEEVAQIQDENKKLEEENKNYGRQDNNCAHAVLRVYARSIFKETQLYGLTPQKAAATLGELKVQNDTESLIAISKSGIGASMLERAKRLKQQEESKEKPKGLIKK